MNAAIESLLDYAIKKNLMDERDLCYARNRILNIFKIEDYEDIYDRIQYSHVDEILHILCDEALKRSLIEDTRQQRDCFDAMIMDCVMMRPSQVIDRFQNASSTSKATTAFYDFSKDSNYIRTSRIAKNISYHYPCTFGFMDITINCSKPEKDPKDIATAKHNVQRAYPTCVLCKENEGFYGSEARDGRSNIRLIPIQLQEEIWYFQYSPYVYYNEHCIVLSKEHEPMKICDKTFDRLLSFVALFPHYFLGANADLPIVGGSILSHDHYQGGNYTFAMAKADVVCEYNCFEAGGVKTQRLYWPLSVIRLSSKHKGNISKAANIILKVWRTYRDDDCDIIAHTSEDHNTISTVARKNGEYFELDLVLRNNRASEKYPLGIFHPHKEIHHIKKENIGIIEVMGLAVLPARLKDELEWIKNDLLFGDKTHVKQLVQHQDWISDMQQRHCFTNDTIDEILRNEVGNIFVEGLRHCGVFKLDEIGNLGFDRFIEAVKKEVAYGNGLWKSNHSYGC